MAVTYLRSGAELFLTIDDFSKSDDLLVRELVSGMGGKRTLSAKGFFVLFRRLRCICIGRKPLAAIVEDRPTPFDAALKLAVQLFQASDFIFVFVRHQKTQSPGCRAKRVKTLRCSYE